MAFASERSRDAWSQRRSFASITLGSVRAAVCQLASTADPADNRSAAVRAVAEGASRGAELVVLPEAMQRSFDPPDADLSADAETLDGPFVAALGEAAAREGVTVVAGMFETVPHTKKVHNSLVIVSAGGLVARYRKLHLYDALGWRESDRVVAGTPTEDASVVVSVAEHRIGVMTCYDVRFPEVARMLVDAGATVLVVPAAFVQGPGKAEQWRVLLQARAMENTAYVVAADQPGPDYTGLSMIVRPAGHVMTSLDESASGVAVAELSVEVTAKVRRALPLLEARRFEVRARPDPSS